MDQSNTPEPKSMPSNAAGKYRATTNLPTVLAIANFLAFLLNCLETFGIGPFSSRFSPNQDNASISQKYQTIITPHGIAFSIWGIIFISEGIFVGSLASERYRRCGLVVEGVSYWFVAVCLAQFTWSPVFAYEKIPLSAFFMGCILLPLVIIVARQYRLISKYNVTTTEHVKPSDYWMLQFPFEIHLGWISAAFALNLNIVAVDAGASADTQVIVAAISLVVLALVAFACLFGVKRPQFVFPWVAAWATFWMSYELRNPKKSISDTFSSDQIHSFLVATSTLSVILSFSSLVRWIYYRFVALPKIAAGQENASLLRRVDAEVN